MTKTNSPKIETETIIINIILNVSSIICHLKIYKLY